MFISTNQEYSISQQEHARLAGEIAALWGNKKFSLSGIDNNAFIEGVKHHDDAFGEYDSFSVADITIEKRIKLIEKTLSIHEVNPTIQLIRLYHWLRLLNYYSEQSVLQYKPLFQSLIKDLLEKNQLNAVIFQRLDSITDIADSIAFDFSFGKDVHDSIMVVPSLLSDEKVEVHYSIQGEIISLDPWPLSVDCYVGFVTHYKKEDYPLQLNPIKKKFILKKYE